MSSHVPTRPRLSHGRRATGATRGLAVLVALGLPATLAACSTASAGPQPETSAGPTPGGTIVHAHVQEPPCIFGGWIQQAYLSRQVLDSLVSAGEGGEVVPWLATDWSVSDDQLVWTFTLKEGVSFTDGTPLDAQAVVDNFEYWLNEGGNSTVAAYLADYYASSRAVDPLTFELTLSAPYSALLPVLSQAYFGIQSPTGLERGAQASCEEPIGSGPFVVAGWERGSVIRFERNPDYTSAPANALHQGPAYVDGIEWRIVPDPVARFGALTTGEADVVYDVPSNQWALAESEFETQLYITPGRPVALGLNTVAGPFEDVRVRQAFAFATDRQAAVESAFTGVVPFEGNGTVSQSTPGYAAEAADDYPYDPDRANELLDDAGWTEIDDDGVRSKDGVPLQVRIVYGAGTMITPEGATVLQNIQEQARATGFDVILVPATRDELFSGAFSSPDSYDAKPGYWTSPTAGILYITFRQHLEESPNFSNSSFYNNPEVEQLILAANSTLDRAEQDRLYGQAQQILSDEAVSVGLYTQTTSLAIDPALRDVWLEQSQGEPVYHDAWFAQ